MPGNVTRRGAKISLARRKAIKSRLVSLDHARRDLDYELFFMMKESGGHYYSPELLRNLHLVSDFSSHFGFKSGRDPLARVQIWRDRHRHGTARDILTTVHRYTREFHKNYNRYRKTDFAKRINFTVMALMMAANPRNLLRNAPSKCCSEYFQDFLNLFRELLQSKRYESMIHTPSHHRNEDYWAQMELIHHLGRALFTRGQGLGQVRSVLSYFREDYGNIAPQEDFAHLPITKALDATYRMMRTVSAHHPDGPLNRLLEELEVKQFRGFDPLHQGNIPSRLFSLFYGNDTVAFARLACPTRQMRVDRASVLEEFKTSLRVSHRDTTPRKHLIINLQDRTNWRELHRSLALENLPLESDFKKYIAVVTLGRNTDFYHQLAPYHDQDDYEGFKQVFHEQLISMDTGYHFPAFVKKDLTMKVLLGLMNGIHAVFFNKKANLDRSERLNFIELYHLFLSVKCIDIIHPCSCSFVCKDSLDLSPCMSAALRILLTMLNEGELKDEELQDIEALVNVPVLLVRERMIQPQVHDRFLKVVECIERSRREATSAQAFLSSVTRNFSDFYDKPLIRGSYFRSPRPAQPW